MHNHTGCFARQTRKAATLGQGIERNCEQEKEVVGVIQQLKRIEVPACPQRADAGAGLAA